MNSKKKSIEDISVRIPRLTSSRTTPTIKRSLMQMLVAAGLIMSMATTASADWLNQGATITHVRALTRTTGYWFEVGTSGGSGACKNQVVRFKRSSSPNATEIGMAQMVLKTALAALLSGKTVRTANGDNDDCEGADLIVIEQ